MGLSPLLSRYGALPARLYTRQAAVPVADPRLIIVNDGLAAELGVDADGLRSPEGVAQMAGNAVPEGAQPLAQAYAGHQFGGFVPQLGDGRALLLGERDTADGLRDIQLKGSGPTPYSRGGDGRAWLGPVLREYLMSEALHAMGLPSTRALAALRTGEQVQRETSLPGAILVRVGRSHIRVGTFQYLAARQDVEGLRALTEHAMARHAPQADGVAGFLTHVVQAQADLIAGWMSIGFIHGVMNTDNCAISAETIDYGPCAMMEAYRAGQVYSAIDRQGRYAYGNQPRIAHWNLAQFAGCLLLLMPNEDAAIAQFTQIINRFPDLYEAAWARRFAAKLGLGDQTEQDVALITDLLARMEQAGLDFTRTFLDLPDTPDAALQDWLPAWQARRAPDWRGRMAAANPHVVPRLHLIEAVIQAAQHGDDAPFHALLAEVTDPFRARASGDPFAQPATPETQVSVTTCGT